MDNPLMSTYEDHLTNFDAIIARLRASAGAYALAQTSKEHIDVRPSLKLAVVTCMDSRIDLFDILGLSNGEAHVLRNAGGVVTDDVIRSLVISQRVLGTESIVLIHHTDCGLQKISDDGFKDEIEKELGIRPPWAVEAFKDPVPGVRQSCRRLVKSPFLEHRSNIHGFVYDVDTYELKSVSLPDFP